jgi:hypothetical protein
MEAVVVAPSVDADVVVDEMACSSGIMDVDEAV